MLHLIAFFLILYSHYTVIESEIKMCYALQAPIYQKKIHLLLLAHNYITTWIGYIFFLVVVHGFGGNIFNDDIAFGTKY